MILLRRADWKGQIGWDKIRIELAHDITISGTLDIPIYQQPTLWAAVLGLTRLYGSKNRFRRVASELFFFVF